MEAKEEGVLSSTLTHVPDEVLRALARVYKVLRVVVVRIGALCALQEDVGVLVGSATVFSENLSNLLNMYMYMHMHVVNMSHT